MYSGSTKDKKSFEEEKAAEIRAMMSPNVKFVFKQVIVRGELVVSHIEVENNTHTHLRFGDD